MKAEGKLIVVSGPAGSGKNTVCERLMAKYPNVERVVTSTSRPPRGTEQNGIDYNFFPREEFERLISQNAFYEWAKVHDNYYGTLKSTVLGRLNSGKDLILIIDVQGAKAWIKIAKEDAEIRRRLTTVFIMPSGIEELKARLRTRATDSDTDIARRMKTAEEEMGQLEFFDRVIDSKTKDEDFNALEKIYLEKKY